MIPSSEIRKIIKYDEIWSPGYVEIHKLDSFFGGLMSTVEVGVGCKMGFSVVAHPTVDQDKITDE